MSRPARFLFGALVAAILLYLILPVLIIVPMSFSGARFLAFPPPSWSTRWYEAFLGSAAWMQAARVSLAVACLTTLIATPIGIAAAYAIANSSLRIMRTLQMVLLLPLMAPIIIIGVGVFFIFAKIGFIATLHGLVLAETMLALPYVVVATLAGLRSFDPAQELVARSLGANRFRSFLWVTLPQIRPSVVSGALFAFIAALDETVVALFVSGGQYQTLTKRMFTALRDEIDPTIAAISSLLIAISFLVVLTLGAIGGIGRRQGAAR